jgi:ATP-dependent DNA ligase
VAPDPSLAEAMIADDLEGLVLKDRRSTYRDGSRVGWVKVKDPTWYQRESWRFESR